MDEIERKDSAQNNESKGDDFIIGEGFSIAQEPQSEPEKNKKKEPNKKAIKSIIWVVCIFVFSIGLAALIMIAASDYLGIGPGRGNEYSIEIKQGSSAGQITEVLYENNIIKSKLLFRAYSKLKGYESKYKYGVYVIGDDDGYEGIAQKLINDGAKAKTVTVLIPEMSSVDDIITRLVDAGVGTKSDIVKAIQETAFNYEFVEEIPYKSVYWRLEGYLFPETYSFYAYEDTEECARLAIDKMLREMDKRFTADMRKQAKELGYSMHEILSLASVIELEAGSSSYEDKQKVAEIFYNRINDWGQSALLQSNPTREYPYGSGKYNTYETPGIPVGPLCSPSMESIMAALYPSTSQPGYYYFITDKFMNFYYNKTLAAHEAKNWELINKGIYYPD